VLPGGRNSGQKAEKGPRKVMLAGRICGRILPKVAEKGPKNIFYRNSLFIGTDTLSETNKNFNFISNWPFVRGYVAMTFCEIGRTFSNTGRTFLMYWPENNVGTWQHCL
jgi:hypothetical protein